jgi:hypothetical protein
MMKKILLCYIARRLYTLMATLGMLVLSLAAAYQCLRGPYPQIKFKRSSLQPQSMESDEILDALVQDAELLESDIT